MEFHKALGLSSFSHYPHVTIVFGFSTFQEAVEMVHCSSIPTVIYGRVVPSPFPFEFASFCCQNFGVYESFVDVEFCVPV